MQRATDAREQTIIGQEKEAISLAWNSLMTDNITKGTEIKNTDFQDELNNSGNNTNVRYEDDDENKNFLVNFRDTNHEYIVDKNGKIILKDTNVIEDVSPVVLSGIKSWTENSNTDFHKKSIRETITEIEFVDLRNKTAPTEINETTAWDVSENGDKSIIAWLDGTKLYIGGNGGVKANEDSSYIFYNFSNLKNINFGNNYDTSDVSNMCSMFRACFSLEKLDLSSFNTKNVTNMFLMFAATQGDSTNNPNTCRYMILNEIKFGNKFDTNNVTNMSNMFLRCSSLTNLDLSSFNTSRVTDMNSMFWGCSKLTNLDLSNFNTSNVTDMSSMFTGWDSMLLKTIYVSELWNTSNITSSSNMFKHCDLLVGGNGTTYNSNKIDKEYARIDKSGQAGYFTDKRQDLASNNTELEYIETTGTQYIDTMVVPNQNTGFIIDFVIANDFTTGSGSGWGAIFSARTNGWNNILELGTWNGQNSSGYFVFGKSVSQSIPGGLSKNTRMQASLRNKIYTDPSGNQTTIITSDFTADYSLKLFLEIESNGAKVYSKSKLYSFKLYDGNTLIRNFVPVHNTITNSAGLYDTVNHKFYPNNGTGTFTEGPVK